MIAAAGVGVVGAALALDPDRARGLDGTLRSSAQTAIGPWLLGLIAGGPAGRGCLLARRGQIRRALTLIPRSRQPAGDRGHRYPRASPGWPFRAGPWQRRSNIMLETRLGIVTDRPDFGDGTGETTSDLPGRAEWEEIDPTDPAERTEVADEAVCDQLPPAVRHIPKGRRLVLHKRGTTFVRTIKGPPGAPTVVLLHGWAATAALNWHQAFQPLSQHFRVVAPDMRGHGRGIRSRRPFRLAAVADDVAETLDILDAGPALAVGYSMGGPVAQLLWQRHPQMLSGMVLTATGAEFFPGNRERYAFVALAQILAGTTRASTVARWLPQTLVRRLLGGPVPTDPTGNPMAGWARREMSKHDLRMLMEAGHALATYSSKNWIHRIDVPTSVLITTKDSAINPTAQFRMAKAIPHAHINVIDDGHTACMHPEFGRILTDACLDVQRRIELKNLGRWPTPVAHRAVATF